MFVLLAGKLSGAEPYIWVEGENAGKKTAIENSWYGDVKKGALSEGNWLHHFGGQEGSAEYEVHSTEEAEYNFWIRANPIAGAAMTVVLNEQSPQPVDFTKAIDLMNIAADGKPDMRFIAWIPLGKVQLKKGSNKVVFRMHSGNSNHGALDCFVFASDPFLPNGPLKPGEKMNLAMEGYWAFEPEPDSFSPEAVFDLRSLNEKRAGQSGRVRATPEGDLALGNGQPARFWAVNTTVATPEHARFLAKRGVNMVRIHSNLPPSPKQPLMSVNEKAIEEAQRLVAVMAKEGIYSTYSPMWATALEVGESWEIFGRKGGPATGLVFWNEKFQAAYKHWIKELLTRPNPYAGGTPLGKDPALAIFQIQNEDSLLFWTIQSIEGEERRALGRHFGKWLVKKYGSLELANAAWDEAKAAGDDLSHGVVDLLGMWFWQQEHQGGLARRMADQLHYLSETMRDFNAEIARFIREDLRCGVLVNAGNWRTANQVKMLDCERWSYTANEVIANNRYFTGIHSGDRVGYLVQKGQHFTEKSALTNPRSLPVNAKQVAGKPYIISESTWVSPLSHQSEGPFLVAAYSALNGVDIYYWFAHGENFWDKTIVKWQSANPSIMGGWPAAALMFRRGDIKRGKVAVHEERTLEDLWNARGILIQEEEGFDPNRDSHFPKESKHKAGVDPLAFLVGPVQAVYGGDPKKSHVDVDPFIDHQKGLVRSNTGELELNYKKGIATLDAPKAQGVTGFLGTQKDFKLSTLSIKTGSEYATLLAVALDDRPLSMSRKVLLQVTSTSRPYGWKVTPTRFENDKESVEGFRIEEVGSIPWNVRQVDAEMKLANTHLRKATLLDANGMRQGSLEVKKEAAGLALKLPEAVMYIVLE